MTLSFYEFFAGGGMARLGLGEGWDCAFANDIDARKAAAYRANFPPAEELRLDDIARLSTADLPGRADLAWASFPCQDLSLAGAGAGLKGARSGTVWPFLSLITGLRREGRAPRTIVLENVRGALTANGGADFRLLIEALIARGYGVGALMIDAALFVPQSRPRLFILAFDENLSPPASVLAAEPEASWHPDSLVAGAQGLAANCREDWLWLAPPAPPKSNIRLANIVEDDPAGVSWDSPEKTGRLLAMMSPGQLAKLEAERAKGGRRVGAVYKRMRPDGDGGKVQRAEARFDGYSGCLRTPAGGSSRQQLLILEGTRTRSRLLAPREAARLMGVADDYQLPARYNEAYHLLGDGVVAPIVRYLAETLIEPSLTAGAKNRQTAAMALDRAAGR